MKYKVKITSQDVVFIVFSSLICAYQKIMPEYLKKINKPIYELFTERHGTLHSDRDNNTELTINWAKSYMTSLKVEYW